MRIEWVPIEDVIDPFGMKLMIATCAVLSIFFVGLITAVLTGHIEPPHDEDRVCVILVEDGQRSGTCDE